MGSVTLTVTLPVTLLVLTLLTGDGGVRVGVTVTVEGGAQALAVSPAIHSYRFSIAPVTREEKYKVSFAEYQQ